MSTGYEVVPESLRTMATRFGEARDILHTLSETIQTWTMSGGDLGVIGDDAGYPDTYNTAVQTVADKLTEWLTNFDDAEAALVAVAKNYENLDADYYEKFGYSMTRKDPVTHG